uniref:Uncharacterized protein n=1 Tax=Schistosoma japonicum TaxID=6182 RepID=C7TYW6_SCHJA|nr:hypothetical protein [Schistosoma japonicum]
MPFCDKVTIFIGNWNHALMYVDCCSCTSRYFGINGTPLTISNLLMLAQDEPD